MSVTSLSSPSTSARLAAEAGRWSERHPILSAGGIGVVLAVITWASAPLAPQGGIDQSWQATMAMAAQRAFAGSGALVPGGAAFGSRIQFSYGPLAFLTSNAVWYPDVGVAATVWMALLRVAVLTSLVWSLRRSFSLPAATILAWVAGIAAFLVVTPEPLVGLAILWCLVLARDELVPRVQTALAVALGGFAGLGLLFKFSIGLVILVLALIGAAIPAKRRWWHILEVVGAFVVVLVLGWVATANPIGDLVTWLSSSMQVTLGYSAGMGLEVPALAGDYWRAALVAVLVLGVAAIEMRRLRGVTRWGVGLLTLAVLAAVFKMGFVRHNLHSLIYFGVAAMALASLRIMAKWAKASFAVALAGVTLLGFDTALWIPRTSVSPVAGVEALSQQLRVVSSPAATIADARTAMQAGYGLDPATLAAVNGQTTWVYPWEEALTWAYPQIRYDPPPSFQTYGAYTPSLDRTDARYLASPNAPARILVQPDLALDNKMPQLNPPATRVAMMCNYVQLSATPTWEVLARVAPRCGPRRLIGTVHTGWDRWTAVPKVPAGHAVLATWSALPQSAIATLVGLLLRPPLVNVQVRTGDGPAQTYRFIYATAGEPHIVAPPSTLGSTGAYVPFTIKTLRLTGGGLGQTTGGVTVHFWEVSVAPPGGS